MSGLDRVRWRCRRGLMELEVILERFLNAHYATLASSELAAFDELLGYADADLWRLVGDDNQPVPGPVAADSPQARIIALLRQC